MSLNGLDSPAVQDAYQAAITEAGGWLLLKYASRDSVELLGRGKGGVSEARAAIAKYEETSPVYGVIVYRRRKVLIKYIPEGTSRVLLARTAVHFQDVLEKYSPYEALLDVASAEGLTDTSLAASFPLHTATPSGSSSRLRLDEITEDGEDPGPPDANPVNRTPTGASFASQRHRMERRAEQRIQADRSPTQSIDSSKATTRPTSPLSSNVPSPMKTSVAHFLVRSDSGKPSITSFGSDSVASTAECTPSETSVRDTQSSITTEEPSKPELSPAESLPMAASAVTQQSSVSRSSQSSAGGKTVVETQRTSEMPLSQTETETSSARPSISERSNYEDDLFDFLKPKPKLGPRPITAAERAKRPTVATVSSMPATYRLSMRKPERSRLDPNGTDVLPGPRLNKALPTPPPIPDTPEYDPRPFSRGSLRSAPSHKSTAMTPDKLRLMKAVELRKKQLRKSNPKAESFVPPRDVENPTVPNVPEQHLGHEGQTATAIESESAIASHAAKDAHNHGLVPSYKADSGIELDYEKVDNQKTAESVGAPPIEEPEPSLKSELTERPDEDSRTSRSLESLKLPMPGSFSNSTSPEREVESTQDPSVHLTDESEPIKEPTRTPAINTEVAGQLPKVSPEEDSVRTPTIVLADGSRPITPGGVEMKDDTKSIASDIAGKSGDESTISSTDLAAAWEMSPKRKNSDLARRRQGLVEPLRVETDTDLSDDDFMDELQSAQFEEAKPVTVSMSSPVQQFFSPQRRPSDRSWRSDMFVEPKETGVASQASPVSTGNSANLISRTFESKNGSPATYRPSAPTSDNIEPPTGMKRNVSSEISKRIQALAGTSSRDNSPMTNPSSRPLTPDASSFLSSTRSPTHVRNKSFNAFSRYTSKANAIQSPMTGNSLQQPPSGPVWSIRHDPNTNRESVSVKARIVRPQTAERIEPYNNPDADLQQPQVTVDHKRATPSQTKLPEIQHIDTRSNTPTTKHDSTPTSSTSPTLSRTSKEGARIPQPANQQKALTSLDDVRPTSAQTTAISNDENATPKESRRTSRFFKRMSLMGGKRRSGAQPLGEGSNLVSAIADAASKDKVEVQSITLPAVTIGDLNIQFPDSLLWKRRVVAIDDAGYMKLQPTEPQKASSRRFLLSEFKMPYIPDLDRQELPNSIMLDFVDGTTLQIACEDSVTHLQVTHVLKTYWRAWAKSV